MAEAPEKRPTAVTPDLGDPSPIEEISLSELTARLKDPTLTIVDVLPAGAYQQGHIPGAVSLPLAEVSERAPAVLRNKHAEIAVYCAGFS